MSEHDFPSTWVWRVIEEFIRSRVGLDSSRAVLSGEGAWDDIVAYCFNAVLTSMLSSNISLLTHPHSMQKQNSPISFVTLPFQPNSSYCSSNSKAKNLSRIFGDNPRNKTYPGLCPRLSLLPILFRLSDDVLWNSGLS
jgi:hypothetical protein